MSSVTSGPDDSLLRGVLAGEPGPVRTLLDELESLAMRIARGQHRLGREEAEDILVAVVEKLWSDDRKALRDWSGRGPLRGYLAVIVNRYCLMRARRQRARPAEVPVDSIDAFPAPESPGDGAAEAVEQADLSGLVREALGLLAERDRQLIQMRFMQEADYDAIMAETGSTYGAARKAVHTAIRRLREEMRRLRPEVFPSEPPGVSRPPAPDPRPGRPGQTGRADRSPQSGGG